MLVQNNCISAILAIRGLIGAGLVAVELVLDEGAGAVAPVTAVLRYAIYFKTSLSLISLWECPTAVAGEYPAAIADW